MKQIDPINQIEEHLLMMSPKSEPENLSDRISKKQLRKSIYQLRKQKKQKQSRKSNNYIINNSGLNSFAAQNDMEDRSRFQFSSVVSQPQENQDPQAYLKLNKLMRATKQLTTVGQYEKQDAKKYFVFTPQQKFIILMNLATIVVTYLYFTQIPISIAFQNHRQEEETEKAFEFINIPALFIFIFGAIIKARTAYFQYGILIQDTKLITINYFKRFFLIDLFSFGSIIIYEFSEVFHKGPIAYRFIILLFYLKIGELVEMQKYVINLYDMNRRVKALLKLFLLLVKIFMLCNIVACGFFYISENLCKQGGIYQGCETCCWTRSLKFNGKSIRECEWSIQYTYSIYWASTTMISIGYGDITPQNKYQISYTVTVQFISCLVYAYSLNQIWGIIQQLNSKKFQIQHRISVMNTYMRDKNIAPALRSKIKAYLLHFYHTKNVREKQLQKDIISELTPSLKTQLFYESYGFIFKGHNFFKNFTSDSLETSSRKIIESGYFQEETIYCPFQQQGKNMLFYIQQGQVQNYIQLHKNRIPIRKIYLDQTVGLKEFITQLNYKSSLVAIKYSVCYNLKYDDWKESLSEQDEDFEKFFVIREKLIFQKAYKQIDVVCQFCRQKDHATQDCFHAQFEKYTRSFLQRYKTKSQRRFFKRQNTISSHIASRISIIQQNISMINASRIKNTSNINIRQRQRFGRKISLDIYGFNKKEQHSDRHRHKKVVHKNQRIHNELVKQLKTKIQVDLNGQDLQDLYSQDSQILLSTDNIIDKVQIFDWYYPQYNAVEDIKNKNDLAKKRMTVMNVLNLH